MSDDLDLLISRADLDGLVRHVDAACDAQDWEHLLQIRASSIAALRTGRQLWPVATLAGYRAALLAPAAWAAQVISDDTATFSLGPLTEVIAQHHTWTDLEPHLAPGPSRAFVAHERVLRGDTIENPDDIETVLDIPLHLEEWEPAYALAVYKPNDARFDPPPIPPTPVEATLPRIPEIIGDPDTDEAVRALLEPWTVASNGRVDVVTVEGDHLGAIAALGPARARVSALTAPEAIAWLGWAGASGGAHGRRRGGATGRFNAWWTIAALAGVLDEWPLEAEDLGDLARGLQWFWWDAFEPTIGWQLQLAVCDPTEGLAWAVRAHDLA